eukprot:13169109-Ditylum_brightwellii.AAC.1
MTQTVEREHILHKVHNLLKEVLPIQCLTGEQCTAVDLAATYHNLGTVLSNLGTVYCNEVLKLFQEALFIQTEICGTHKHPLVAEKMAEMTWFVLAWT